MGLAFALNSCSVDSKNPVSLDHSNSEGTRVTSIDDARKKLKIGLNDNVLESRIDEAINGFNVSAKPTSSVENFSYDAKLGDFNYDHRVDFNDFFLFADHFGSSDGGEYDLDSNGSVDFNDFFLFADQFGKNVNRSPKVENIIVNGGSGSVNIGEEVDFSASVVDREGDEVSIQWYFDDEDNSVNGGNLTRSFSTLGMHTARVRAIDEYEGISEEESREFNVESSGPELSLPDEISFNQYENGVEGNTHTLNLNDYVEDPNFSDDELTWDVPEVEDNSFYHRTSTPGFTNYEAKALELTLSDRNLEINPVANYNSSDHGQKFVEFSVTNPNGDSVSKRVEINVQRTPEFDDMYDGIVTGKGWDVPPERFYIWTGKGVSREGWEWPLTEATGPIATQEEKDYFVRTAELIPTISDFFNPVEIRYTDDWNKWLDNREGSILAYIDDYASGGMTHPFSLVEVFDWSHIGINSISRGNERFFPICLHEMFDHGVGFDHPENDRGTLREVTVFSGGNRLEEIPDLDKTIIDSFYETKQYLIE